jgi:hypothetical protein
VPAQNRRRRGLLFQANSLWSGPAVAQSGQEGHRPLTAPYPDFVQDLHDFAEYARIFYCRRHWVILAIGDAAHRAAQDLARARLRQAGDDERRLEARARADAVVHERDGLALDVRAGRATPALSTRKPNGT